MCRIFSKVFGSAYANSIQRRILQLHYYRKCNEKRAVIAMEPTSSSITKTFQTFRVTKSSSKRSRSIINFNVILNLKREKKQNHSFVHLDSTDVPLYALANYLIQLICCCCCSFCVCRFAYLFHHRFHLDQRICIRFFFSKLLP